MLSAWELGRSLLVFDLQLTLNYLLRELNSEEDPTSVSGNKNEDIAEITMAIPEGNVETHIIKLHNSAVTAQTFSDLAPVIHISDVNWKVLQSFHSPWLCLKRIHFIRSKPPA